MDKYRELIFRKKTNYIVIWTFIISILLISFIVLGCFYKYNKFKEYNGLVIEKEGEKFVQLLVSNNELDIIKNDSLIIDRKEIKYSYEIDSSVYSDNNKLYNLVNLKIDNIPEEQIISIIFKSEETTFLNEIKNKIKKGMI